MQENEKEKVILVGSQTDQTDRNYEYSMEELESLTSTANGRVISTLNQKQNRLHASTYIGKGKLEELQMLEEELEPDIIIFNDELTPGRVCGR